MLDQLFYNLDKAIYTAGSDWAVIGIFILIILVFVYFILALQVNRLLHAGVAAFVLLLVTFAPLVSFPPILDGIYLHLGLLTPWFVENVPHVIRFPTLWLPVILVPVAVWTVLAMILDTLRGQPLLTKKIRARNHQLSAEASRRMIDELCQKNLEQEKMKEDPAGLH
ncbi:hypothetical protein ACFPOG_12435 [Paenibacillus aestuarii]|uniref:TIGR03546 family protein n=1 Tax=Paenibacillus aestuarii TaxID=516965 RepID=A0ABW0K8P9_9BACL